MRAARLQTTRNSRTLNALGGADSQRAQTLRRCCADRNPDFAAIRSRSNLLWVTSSFAKTKRISCTKSRKKHNTNTTKRHARKREQVQATLDSSCAVQFAVGSRTTA